MSQPDNPFGHLPSPEEEYAAGTPQPIGSAPRNGTPIVARDHSGEVAMIRWRVHPDVDEEGDDPYWARMDTDEPFEPAQWVPTTWTIDDILKFYG